MKRKVVGLLMALTLSLGVTACTNVAEVTSDSKTESSADKTQSDETGSEKDDPGKDASQKDDSGEGKTDSGEKKESIKERVLFSGYYANVYYGVNEKGEKVSEYRWKDVCDAVEERGTKLNGYVEAMGDGLFFFRDTENIGSNYVYSVYAIDADVNNYWCTNVCTLDENWWIGSVDYYQGKLYVTEESGNDQIKETVYERSADGLFVKVDNPYDAVIQSMQGYNLLLNSPNFGNKDVEGCITRSLDEKGFVLGYKDGYYKIAKDGSVSKVTGMPAEYSYSMLYDENGAVVQATQGNLVTTVTTVQPGVITVADNCDHSYTAVYYADGNLARLTDNVTGNWTGYSYDANGRVNKEYVYDNHNRLQTYKTFEFNEFAKKKVQYTYNAKGKLLSIKHYEYIAQ